MKQRIYFIIMMCAVTLSGMAQTVGEEMYIYRSDGQVNGFLPSEVLSIEYSDKDASGNTYDEIVTQIVNTTDSVYIIPLAEIDSISFITPKTEYKAGVINLSDELMPYVVSSSSEPLSITFNSSTPSSIMPHVGDKLVTLEMNDKFPVGFVGEVTAVSGTLVTCSKVSLEDVFDSYRAVSSTYGYQEGDMAPRYSSRRVSAYGNKDFKLGTFTWSKGAELSSNLFGSDNLALKGGTELSIEMTPSFHVISTLIISSKEGTYFNACITGDITFKESVSAYGSIEWSKDFLDNEWVKAPVAPLTYFYVAPGLFLSASADVTVSTTWTQRFTWGAAFDFSTKKRNVVKPTCGGRLASSSFNIEGAVNGSLTAGAFLEVGLTIISRDIDKLCFRGELGAELVGQAVLYGYEIAEAAQNTEVYERFKESGIEANAFVTASLQAELGPWGISYSLPWELNHNIKTWDIVPKFKSVTPNLVEQVSAFEANATILGNCLTPAEVGFSLRDNEGKEVASYYSPDKFKNGIKRISYIFNNLSDDEQYILNAKIKIFGYEMLASESLVTGGICPDDNHPHWIDLGLSSGTLWRCCNQGASKPEDYGGHYTRGGADSAPTVTQFSELASNILEWGTLNGVNGLIITGANGNSIFLPAAGDDGSDGGESHAGYTAYYWTSSNNYWHWRWGRAFDYYNFSFRPGGYTSKCSVRPVQ